MMNTEITPRDSIECKSCDAKLSPGLISCLDYCSYVCSCK